MNKKKRTYSQETIDQYKRTIKYFEGLEPEGVTVLTGTNGSGKSLIRKQMPFAVQQWYELEDVKETKGMIKSTSMDARTGSRPELGALSSIMNDVDWVATSQNTFGCVEKMFNAVEKDEKTKYLIVDEFEIGLGEETVLAIVQYMNERIKKLMDAHLEGAIVITHSRLGVQHLVHDHFVNLDGMTEDEWLNREVIPTDLKKLDNNELFFYIRDKQNDK